MKNHTRLYKKLMAYFIVPLLFIFIDIVFGLILLSPIFDDIRGYSELLLLNEVPEFIENSAEIEKEELINRFNTEMSGYVTDGSEVQNDVEIIPLADIDWPVYGDAYAWISCERLGLDSVVYYGDGYELLRKGVGQYIGSYIPGFGRPLMLCAHNTNIFACLENIEIGDEINMKTFYGEFSYAVKDVQILKDDDLDAYDMRLEKEQLIMYTCYPFERLSTRHKYRYFVYCDKISGPVLE